MNDSPILVSLNAIFAVVAIVAYFFRNHYLRKLAQARATSAAGAPTTSYPNASQTAVDELEPLLRNARVAAVICGAGVIGAVVANLTMQATFGP